jgi:hypothetical protein
MIMVKKPTAKASAGRAARTPVGPLAHDAGGMQPDVSTVAPVGDVAEFLASLAVRDRRADRTSPRVGGGPVGRTP